MLFIVRSGIFRAVLATFSLQKYFRSDFLTRSGEILGRGGKGKKTATRLEVESSLHGAMVQVLGALFSSKSAFVEEDEALIFSNVF